MSLHEFLEYKQLDPDDILRIEKGYFNNENFGSYIKSVKELDLLLSWLTDNFDPVIDKEVVCYVE